MPLFGSPKISLYCYLFSWWSAPNVWETLLGRDPKNLAAWTLWRDIILNLRGGAVDWL